MRREQRAWNSRHLRGDDRAGQEVVRHDGVGGLGPKRVHRVGRIVDRGLEHDLPKKDSDLRPDGIVTAGVRRRYRGRPPPGEGVEPRLCRLLMVIGLAQDANAVTPLAQPAGSRQEGIQISRVAPGGEQEI
jgi:hypothetical protein